MKTLKLSRKKESASLLLFSTSKSPGSYAIYCRNARILEMQNFTPAYMKGWTYVQTYSIRMIFSEPKFPWRIVYQFFLPMVIHCLRFARESSAINYWIYANSSTYTLCSHTDQQQLPINKLKTNCFHSHRASLINASVNSSCVPGYCRAFARLVSLGGGTFANFALPGGLAFANPRGQPWNFDKHVVSYQNITTQKMLLEKTSRLAHLSRTGKNWRGL